MTYPLLTRDPGFGARTAFACASRSVDGSRRETTKAEPSADAILQLGSAYRGAKVLLSAVELDVFTVLAASPLDAEALRARVDVHERAARDFFDALVALGMLERHDGIYSNTPAADRYLDRRKPSYIGGFLEMSNSRLYANWGCLTQALQTGRPQNEAAGGDDVFAAMYRDPRALAEFVRGMTGLSLLQAAALARLFPWARYQTFIDVGTAEGALPVEIARVHPHLKGGGFDLPAIRAPFEAYVRRHSLSERLQFYPGDFLKEPLPSADVLVMGHILHDWDLDVKLDLLAKARASLPTGGALIVYDQMIDDARCENAAGLLASLSMLLQTHGGFDYTGADCMNWLSRVGFQDMVFGSLHGTSSMVIGIK
jgi:hypothetical protein